MVANKLKNDYNIYKKINHNYIMYFILYQEVIII
jgi:hypothetical protein